MIKKKLAELGTSVEIGHTSYQLKSLPKGYRVDPELGLVIAEKLEGQIVHENAGGGLFEPRATKTPAGDYLLMFPDTVPELSGRDTRTFCGHYGAKESNEKVNNLIAYRSKDRGKTWCGPTLPFDIDYNQHGFVPLIPRGSKRIYAFGTQPIWEQWSQARGLDENAPIGYRYSDDDGYTWSEVRIIHPQNDPDFCGMSVMRMCETDSGAWILGAHECDFTYKSMMSRQYILRSSDQGKTWMLVPNYRHGGWHCPGFNRMDEGRPIALGGGKVYMQARTVEGHLWAVRSEDDGLSWSDPQPTPLVHPDAPPMLFHLSDGKTLVAFHHNVHYDVRYTNFITGKPEAMKGRAQLWVAFSEDGGSTWSEPQFLLANALEESGPSPWWDYQCSYLDMFPDNGYLHLFIPHRWRRVLHLKVSEKDLRELSAQKELERKR